MVLVVVEVCFCVFVKVVFVVDWAVSALVELDGAVAIDERDRSCGNETPFACDDKFVDKALLQKELCRSGPRISRRNRIVKVDVGTAKVMMDEEADCILLLVSDQQQR